MDGSENAHMVGMNNNNGGNNSEHMNGNGSDSQPQQIQYSMPGILHFLQTEWARFEMDRAQWDVERAELQARIAFLQGERKGQENLKQDLVRRIKMLEWALRQERAKYHKLKYGVDLNVDTKPVNESTTSPDDDQLDLDSLPALTTPASNAQWKQGRQLLRQYLKEIGYADAIIDVRSARVRSLLGLPLVDGDGKSNRAANANKMALSPAEKALLESEQSVLETLDFLRPGDDEEEGDEEGGEDMDGDTEEALAEFDFLVNEATGEAGDSVDPQSDKPDWRMDQQIINRLTEQYKQDRKGKKPSPPQRPNRDSLQEMLADLSRESPAGQTAFDDTDENHQTSTVKKRGSGANASSAISGDEQEMEFKLGELASLTVANDEQASYSGNTTGDSERKTWTAKYTLRSHFDGIRALAFHPVEPVLITASEDDTLKLWNLQKTVPAKKNQSLDVEPIYTFRGHQDAVLCLVMGATGETCYSAGLDGTIRCWNLPNTSIDTYDSFDASVLQSTMVAHTDAVWGLSLHSSRMQLLSCAADGVCLWNPTVQPQLLRKFAPDEDCGAPTAIEFARYEPNHMIASYSKGETHVFDLETGKPVVKFELPTDATGQINRIVSHPTLPVSIAAHSDKHIRFFDHSTGKMIHSMVAHLDSVTCLAIDPNGLYLLSGSHDCSIRLWNLDNKTCVQEVMAHRRKWDESVYDVAFHPSKAYLASAGQDALAKVFV